LTNSDLITLTSPSSSIIFDTSNNNLVIKHWGAPIPHVSRFFKAATTNSIAHASFDEPLESGVMREHSRGFMGHPTISGHRNGQAWSTLFSLSKVEHSSHSLEAHFADAAAGLKLVLTYQLNEFGVLQTQATLTNTGADSYVLDSFIYWLPLPDRASDVLDFTGRWSRERHPQRTPIRYGLTTREMREGRSGHDYTIAQLALTHGAGFESGEVWGVSLAWSGNSIHHIERLPTGETSMGTGELLLPGEITIGSGQSFEIPPTVANYSREGLDGLSHNYYRWLRSRPTHPTNVRPRPITLNVWEAIDFDHDDEKIKAIVDAAAEVGVERFVLDDGWFHLRRHDQAGLGDWVVDKSVWPHGLAPIIKYINDKGMEFGLWFEGEMVNPDSDLYRAHPEWILHEAGRTPPLARHQLVLDLTHQGAFDHVLGQVDAVLSEYNIAYIKWDHNRVIIDAGHLGQAAIHNQTAAIYRLFAELKKRHPNLEIESCASGGGRIDLGVIDYVDRFWTSDNNDALERQTIQRWTGIAIPPELLGTHIGPRPGNQNRRTTEINFRAITALFGHAGIEWDITHASPEEIEVIKSWIALYKSKRSLLHSGRAIRVDHPDENSYIYGVVAQDKSEALFAIAARDMSESVFPAMARFPGLESSRNYRVRALRDAGIAKTMQRGNPAWMNEADGIVLSGAELASIGLRPPILPPENAILIEISEEQ
jgi:alpha-galactosidase